MFPTVLSLSLWTYGHTASLLAFVLLFACFGRRVKPPQEDSLREEPLCVENSPKRRGEFGCSIVQIKELPSDLRTPVFWHIDRFDQGQPTGAAIGPRSMAFEAHGSWWLHPTPVSIEDSPILQWSPTPSVSVSGVAHSVPDSLFWDEFAALCICLMIFRLARALSDAVR